MYSIIENIGEYFLKKKKHIKVTIILYKCIILIKYENYKNTIILIFYLVVCI